MINYKVAYYRTVRGGEPVRDFVAQQDNITKAKINRYISLLKIYGPELGMPHARHLSAGLYELRIRGKNEVRIFYISILENKTLMLLHGFKKRSQKIPLRELELAKARQTELTSL